MHVENYTNLIFNAIFSITRNKFTCICVYNICKCQGNIFIQIRGIFPRSSKTKNPKHLNKSILETIKKLKQVRSFDPILRVSHGKIFSFFILVCFSQVCTCSTCFCRDSLLFASRHLIYRYANNASFARVWERKCCIPSDVNHGVSWLPKKVIRVWRACVFDTCLFIELLSCILKKRKWGERIVLKH